MRNRWLGLPRRNCLHLKLRVVSMLWISWLAIFFANQSIACEVPTTLRSDGGDKKNNESGQAPPNHGGLTIRWDRVQAVAKQIDIRIQERLEREGIAAAEAADDESFLRRAFLDLAGVPPVPSAIEEYLSNDAADKRAKLLSKLVDAPSFANRLADEWTQVLVPDTMSDPTFDTQRESLRRWLAQKFSTNTRYDRIVSDLLIASGDPAEQPTAFYTVLEVKPEKLAEKTCRVFLGVALDCAQCHDHPFDKWKQPDFWGVAAYFAQVSADGMTPGQMNTMRIADQTVGEVRLPETETIVAPKPLLSGLETSLAIGSRRQQLAIWVTSKQNEWFAKATVNRTWAMLMGRGIVEPVDDMSSKNIPSHPELLQELADSLRSSGYDLKELILGIVLSDTYARSSKHPKSKGIELYASMIPKPLTSHQLSASLRQMSRQNRNAMGPDQWDALGRELGPIRAESSEFVGGALQSLVLQNSKMVETLWDENSSKLLKALHAPHLNHQERIEWMYLSTLCRKPTPREAEFLMKIEASNEEGVPNWESDLLWALINSTEFATTP